MRAPTFVAISRTPDGWTLGRYAEFGTWVGDTWHSAEEDAQAQAAREYGERLSWWVPLAPGTQDLAGVDAQLWPDTRTDSERAPWPSIIEVTLRSIDGHDAAYTALTFYGEPKAIAMATEAHYRSGRPRVDSASANVIGPAPRNTDGTVGQGPPGVLEDRGEF
jgi:hypothetical protein